MLIKYSLKDLLLLLFLENNFKIFNMYFLTYLIYRLLLRQNFKNLSRYLTFSKFKFSKLWIGFAKSKKLCFSQDFVAVKCDDIHPFTSGSCTASYIVKTYK